MKITELRNRVNEVLFSQHAYGLTVYACIKENADYSLKKLQMTDALKESVKTLVQRMARIVYLSEEAELENFQNISDNRKILYEVPQTDLYSPFCFLDDYHHVTDTYNEQDQSKTIGYFFRVNRNDTYIWFFQMLYPIHLLDRSKELYAVLGKGETYTILDKDIMRFDNRLDLAIVNGSIITEKISILQKYFGFEDYIRSEAHKTVLEIEALNLLSDTAKFMDFINKERLTNAKKLMKVKNSPVLKMNKTELFRRLQKHPRYQNKFKYDGDTIVIKTQKDVNDFIKMLNDDIVRSDLTDQEYDSPSKQILAPLNQ